MITVLTALQAELRPLLKRLSSPSPGFAGFIPYWQASYGEIPLILSYSGIGTPAAYCATKQLLRIFSPSLVISFGACGALTGDLEPSRLVVTREALLCNIPANYLPGHEERWQPEQILRDHEEIAPILEELIGSVSRVTLVRTVTADLNIEWDSLRGWLFERLGAESCDQETFAVYRAASAGKTPALSLRLVTDTAGDDALSQFSRNFSRFLPSAVDFLLALLPQLAEVGNTKSTENT